MGIIFNIGFNLLLLAAIGLLPILVARYFVFQRALAKGKAALVALAWCLPLWLFSIYLFNLYDEPGDQQPTPAPYVVMFLMSWGILGYKKKSEGEAQKWSPALSVAGACIWAAIALVYIIVLGAIAWISTPVVPDEPDAASLETPRYTVERPRPIQKPPIQPASRPPPPPKPVRATVRAEAQPTYGEPKPKTVPIVQPKPIRQQKPAKREVQRARSMDPLWLRSSKKTVNDVTVVLMTRYEGRDDAHIIARVEEKPFGFKQAVVVVIQDHRGNELTVYLTPPGYVSRPRLVTRSEMNRGTARIADVRFFSLSN